MKSGSRLESIRESGQFAVTAEAGPPKGNLPDSMRKKGDLLKAYCDALNVTDNHAAMVRMSSLAGCLLLKEAGAEPVLQMVVRDRNRLALESDLIGATDVKETGIRQCLELIDQLKRVPGVHGIHIMAVAWEEIVPRIVEEAGLFPRPPRPIGK